MAVAALKREAKGLIDRMDDDKIMMLIDYAHLLEDADSEPTPQLAGAMLEALQISKDPAAKTFSSTEELFRDLED